MPAADATIFRRFVDIPGGQVHYRTAGEDKGGTPLVMFHASPSSSKLLTPLIGKFGLTRRVIAPDTMGNGDSSAPPKTDSPEIDDFVDWHLAAMDKLGLGTVDLYGSHTGAGIAAEIAIRHPDRVRRLIVDGITGKATPGETDALVKKYAPGVTISHDGAYVTWLWSYIRDTFLFWPWFEHGPANVRDVGLPSADDLHDKFVELLKATRTYHLPYKAAFRHNTASRIHLIKTKWLYACGVNDMLIKYYDANVALVPNAVHVKTPGVWSPEATWKTVEIFNRFLDGDGTTV